MFASRLVLTAAVLLVVTLAALGAARPTSGAARGDEAGAARYVVERGDTLWEIAAHRYGGDPREGVWLIRERNGIGAEPIQPGQVLVLP